MPTTAADPLIGRTLGGARLTARLGSGSMGVVYRAWHERLEREVAVKVLPASRASRNQRERFLREGRAAARIRHANVVEVHDAGEQDGTAYLMMELIDGRTLGNRLDQEGAIPWLEVRRLAIDIARGLAAIHSQEVVHRDVKPDNILVTPAGISKISDLGLAKVLDDDQAHNVTATGVVVGTPLYVSPEAIRDPSSITGRSDVYGLGVTLYHLITGKTPFEGQSPYEVMHGHLEVPPPNVRTLKPEVPVAFADLILRCLAKEPNERPAAMELADLLAKAAKPTSSTARLAVWLGLLAVAMACATGALYLFR